MAVICSGENFRLSDKSICLILRNSLSLMMCQLKIFMTAPSCVFRGLLPALLCGGPGERNAPSWSKEGQCKREVKEIPKYATAAAMIAQVIRRAVLQLKRLNLSRV